MSGEKTHEKSDGPAIDIFRKWTFKTHISLKTTNATGHHVSFIKSVENMFFMFRLRSLNTLIALHRALSLLELPSRTRHKNLSHRLFVMGLTYL